MAKVRPRKSKLEEPPESFDGTGGSSAAWALELTKQQEQLWAEMLAWVPVALRLPGEVCMAPKKAPAAKATSTPTVGEPESSSEKATTTATPAKKKRPRIVRSRPSVTAKREKPSSPKTVKSSGTGKAVCTTTDDGEPMVKVGKGKNAKMIPLHVYTSRTMLSILETERSKHGDANIMAAGEADRLTIGIPMPFALEWCVQSNVFPLSRIVQLVGRPGANKSALAFEIARWFRKYHGFANLFENETKYNATLALSILGWPKNADEEAMSVTQCHSCEHWQQMLTEVTEQTAKRMATKRTKDNPTPIGPIYPVLNIVDSVMGKLSQEDQSKIKSRGYGGKKFPIEALAITNYLKTYPQQLMYLPISLVLVNHLRIRKAEQGGHTERIKSGGEHISFQESLELEMSKIKDIHQVNKGENTSLYLEGNRLQIRCAKSSYGKTGLKVQVNFLWEKRITEHGPRQFSHWDWNSAAVDLLLEHMSTRDGELRKIVDIVSDSKEKQFWSKRLGITKANPVNKTKLGKLITSNKEIRSQLRDLFGIRSYKTFKPGVSYVKQLQQLTNKLEREMSEAV